MITVKVSMDIDLTYLGVIRTAARHQFNKEAADPFVNILNEFLARGFCNPKCGIRTEEHMYILTCLHQLETYSLIDHHVIHAPADTPLSKETLLQSDSHTGIALIKHILDQITLLPPIKVD